MVGLVTAIGFTRLAVSINTLTQLEQARVACAIHVLHEGQKHVDARHRAGDAG